jgi:hypothetical protein
MQRGKFPPHAAFEIDLKVSRRLANLLPPVPDQAALLATMEALFIRLMAPSVFV